MTDHEPKQTVTAIFAEVASEYASLPGNGATIVEETVKRALAAYDEDALVDEFPSATQLQAKWLAARLNRSAQSTQARLSRSVSAGQSLLDMGTDFDLVLTVCGAEALAERGDGNGQGRKTTLGLFNADDLALLGRESAINRATVDRADDAVQRGVGVWTPKLRMFANYRQMSAQVAS